MELVRFPNSSPDRVKEQIEFLTEILSRLHAGEEFTSIIVGLTSSEASEYYYSGTLTDTLIPLSRLMHVVNKSLDTVEGEVR